MKLVPLKSETKYDVKCLYYCYFLQKESWWGEPLSTLEAAFQANTCSAINFRKEGKRKETFQ